jgi:hypothetical protein
MKRPLSISIIGAFFVGLGTFVILANVFWLWQEYLSAHSLVSSRGPDAVAAGTGDEIWVFATQLLAIVAGVFLLRGHNWARWLLVAWLGFHVGLSALHPGHELVVHGVLMGVFVYILFRRPATEFFRGGGGAGTPGQ